MFKELRNKFLILNLVSISVMMLIAFSTIYFITYSNIQKDINLELHRMPDFNHRIDDNVKNSKQDLNNTPMAKENAAGEVPPNRSLSFTLTIDSNGNITNTPSFFNMTEAFYKEIKDMALSKSSNTGRFKYDNSQWAFNIRSAADGRSITFLDITDRQAILTRLIYTFIAVAMAMLIVIYFISRYFANRSIKPIKEAFDRQKQFIGDASHELKTPLSVINTNVDVLLANKEESIESQSKWLNYIKSEVERMSKLTNDLLYLTQMDYSETKMIFSNFNISDAVENVILTMEAVSFENNITLDSSIEPDIMVNGNSEQIKQVVMILLDNALKYTDEGGKVSVKLKRTGSNISLTVSNTGQGIPQEHVDKIFDRFYRIDKSRSRKSGGYGLGLAIAKAIVEEHGGRISVKSIQNESTTFTIEL